MINFGNISYEKLEEIRKEAVEIKNIVIKDSTPRKNGKNDYPPNYFHIIAKSRKIYIGKNLNKDIKENKEYSSKNIENNIFELYSFFPQDDEFMREYKRYNRNVEKMSKSTLIPEYIIMNRYKLYIYSNKKKLEALGIELNNIIENATKEIVSLTR